MKSILLAALMFFAALPAAAQMGPAAAPAPAIAAPRDVAYPGVIRLQVDASDVQRRIWRVRETIPVTQPGRLTLLYPQWLPGNHAPRGPIERLAGLQIRAGGRLLNWTRDPVEVHAIHVDVPAGVREVEASFQALTPTEADQGRIVVTPEMLNLQWNLVTLYPAGHYASRITVEPSVTLPEGWRFGVALDPARTRGATTTFKPVSLETLIDSPMFAGRYYRQVDLDPDAAARKRPPVRLNIVADSPEQLEIKPEQLQMHRNLVVQADRLFGSRPFDRYEFLLGLTGRLGGIGLEHHRSSENTVNTRYFLDWNQGFNDHDLLPHEYVHSWNGKHRRGADLWTPNYNVPMRDSLLWVYEGQTSYWTPVLAARSGMLTKDQALQMLASQAAALDARTGRAWRDLADTTFGPIVSARRPQPWGDWQRPEDYYTEGALVWLEVDTLIRERSNGRRSLDDFARTFFGGRDGDWRVYTYTFDDVAAALNAVEPYDWATLLRTRLDENASGAPLQGFARGGYRLIYTDTPSPVFRDDEAARRVTELTYSLGMVVNRDAKLTAVRWEGPAFDAGLTVGTTLVAVNGLAYDADRLKAAITAARGGGAPIELQVRHGDHLRTVRIPYHLGLRYPHLERVAGTPARLDDILAPRS